MENPSSLLVVQNLEDSLEFYTKILCLELVEKHSDCIKLIAGQHEIIMFESGLESIEYSHGYNANSTLLFTVSDLEKEIGKLESQGVTFVHDTPNQNRWGRYAAFKDPSGIIHELFEHHT
jgi:catechol 2,3-dioxygenase-like lactoylglutathione lyase family enzyme